MDNGEGECMSATGWHYRMANNYAAGSLISRAGPMTESEARAGLMERYQCDVDVIQPAGRAVSDRVEI